MNNKGDFSQGSIFRHLVRLALPVMLAEFVHILYNLVDRMYIGRIPGSGTASLSGLGVCFPLITIINAFAGLFGTGGAPLCSIARGRGDDRQAQRIMETAFTMLLISSAVLMLVLFLFMDRLLYALGADSEIITYSKDYFGIYLLGTVFVLISLGMNPFINMQGRSVVGMATVLIGAFLNIVLDPVFIFVMGMGVKGAAIATVISQMCSAVWVMIFLTSRHSAICIKRLRLEKSICADVARLGITGFMFKATNSVTQAVCNVMLRAAGGSLGTLYIGSMSIINSVREIISQPCSSITSSLQPIAGYNYGARRYTRSAGVIKTAFFTTGALNILFWLAVQLFPAGLVRIFTPDGELARICIPCMKIYFAAFPFMTFQMVGQSTFVGMNCPRRAVFFSLLRKIILILPLTLVLPRTGLGVNGVFYAEMISQLVGASACSICMYFTVYRKLKTTPDGTPLTL